MLTRRLLPSLRAPEDAHQDRGRSSCLLDSTQRLGRAQADANRWKWGQKHFFLVHKSGEMEVRNDQKEPQSQ